MAKLFSAPTALTYTNPFPQLTPNRVRAALPRLQKLIWTSLREIPICATEPSEKHISWEEARGLPLTKLEKGVVWGKLFDQRWFHLDLQSSQPHDYLHWKNQGEATLYVDGIPYYGFDPMHRYCLLPEGIREAWVEEYCCQTFGQLSDEGDRYGGGFLVQRNENVWHGWLDLTCLAELAFHLHQDRETGTGVGIDTAYHYPALESVSPLLRQLLSYLEAALNALESTGVEAMRTQLAAAFLDFEEKSPRIRGCLIGNSHLDLVYLWPERMGEAKAVHTFATALRLLDSYPEFQFSYSQPASYEAVGRRAPEILQQVRSHVSTGRWQATGALYVESDLLIACGEGLARSFSLGQASFRELQGEPSRLVWLPDCFGFPACMPQLMKLAGVNYFFTTKLTWNSINRLPHTSFIWRGNDGSEVLSHVPRSSGYANTIDVGRILSAAQSHTQSASHREFIHPVGFGDGGGGPTEEMCERARRYQALAGVPPLAWDQPEQFFQRLAALTDQLPTFQGELYLEFHRGTQTTHSAVKSHFRALERALQIREAAAVASGSAPDLSAAWKRMVFHQFHDDIPGTAVPEVYEEGITEMHRLAFDLAAETNRELGSSGEKQSCVFNPHPQTWRGWITLPDGDRTTYIEVPPMAGIALESRTRLIPQEVHVCGRRMDNGLVQVDIGHDGSVEALVIRNRPLELIPKACIPVLFPDIPAKYEAWDIDRHTLDLGRPLGIPQEIVVSQDNPNLASISVTWNVGTSSSLKLNYLLEGGSEVLRLEINVDWQEPQALLKLPIPTTYNGRMARYGAPFGSTLRGQQPGLAIDEAKWEVPASRWAAVSHDGERDGLFVVTEAKYGYACQDGRLEVSLVRSPIHTGHQSHGTMTPRHLSRHHSTTIFTDLGRHRIKIAIGAYDADAPRSMQPASLADTLFTSPLIYDGSPIPSAMPELQGGPSLIPSWAVPVSGTSWILRLHEVSGHAGVARLPFADGFQIQPVNLLGEPTGDMIQEGRIRYRPYQIISLLVSRV